MTHRFHSFVALTIAATLLAGCGAKSVVSAVSMPTASSVDARAHITAVDPKVTKLISDYQAVTGQDAAAMTQRDAIIADLGKTDNTNAVAFLTTEYDHANDLPADLKATHQLAIAKALAALDTFDPALDAPAIGAGPGKTVAGSELYEQAAARKARHGTIMHFLTSPLRWTDAALRWLNNALNGKHHSPAGGGGHKPAPAPAGGGGAPAPAPAGGGAPPAPASGPTGGM